MDKENKVKDLLIKHVRAFNRVPFATIVILKDGRYSISVCNTKDMYNKKRGVMIATARAEKNLRCSKIEQQTSLLPNRIIKYYNYISKTTELESVYNIINNELLHMKVRALKYFKTDG